MISLIVPCYNEQEALPTFYEEVMKVVKELNYQYEILFINDGSTDDTISLLKSYAENNSCVTYISF